jgi:hypothetical protein
LLPWCRLTSRSRRRSPGSSPSICSARATQWPSATTCLRLTRKVLLHTDLDLVIVLKALDRWENCGVSSCFGYLKAPTSLKNLFPAQALKLPCVLFPLLA